MKMAIVVSLWRLFAKFQRAPAQGALAVRRGCTSVTDVRWNPAALQGACISLPGDRLPAPPAQLSGKDA